MYKKYICLQIYYIFKIVHPNKYNDRHKRDLEDITAEQRGTVSFNYHNHSILRGGILEWPHHPHCICLQEKN